MCSVKRKMDTLKICQVQFGELESDSMLPCPSALQHFISHPFSIFLLVISRRETQELDHASPLSCPSFLTHYSWFLSRLVVLKYIVLLNPF